MSPYVRVANFCPATLFWVKATRPQKPRTKNHLSWAFWFLLPGTWLHLTYILSACVCAQTSNGWVKRSSSRWFQIAFVRCVPLKVGEILKQMVPGCFDILSLLGVDFFGGVPCIIYIYVYIHTRLSLSLSRPLALYFFLFVSNVTPNSGP